MKKDFTKTEVRTRQSHCKGASDLKQHLSPELYHTICYNLRDQVRDQVWYQIKKHILVEIIWNNGTNYENIN